MLYATYDAARAELARLLESYKTAYDAARRLLDECEAAGVPPPASAGPSQFGPSLTWPGRSGGWLIASTGFGGRVAFCYGLGGPAGLTTPEAAAWMKGRIAGHEGNAHG